MMLSTCFAVTNKTDPHDSLIQHLADPEPSEVHTGNFGFGGPFGSTLDDVTAVSSLLDQPHIRGVDFASPEVPMHPHCTITVPSPYHH